MIMRKLFVLIPLFATVWQAQALDWGSRIASEQEWLIQSLTPPVEKSEVNAEEMAFMEDSISTGQAAVQKQEIKKVEETLPNPWDIRDSQAPVFQPAKKRSR